MGYRKIGRHFIGRLLDIYIDPLKFPRLPSMITDLAKELREVKNCQMEQILLNAIYHSRRGMAAGLLSVIIINDLPLLEDIFKNISFELNEEKKIEATEDFIRLKKQILEDFEKINS